MLSKELRERIVSRYPLYSYLFDEQIKAVLDPSLRQAWLTSRRSGKTIGASYLVFQSALDNPGDNFIYIALTRSSAHAIVWKEFKGIIDRHRLRARQYETSHIVEFSNGSTIHLHGADQSNWLARIEGTKNRAAVVDESGLMKPRILDDIVYNSVGPTLLDQGGKLILIGRPGSNEAMGGLFHRASEGKIPGWGIHKWLASDNPYVRAAYHSAIAELKLSDPNIEQTAAFRRNYLAEWVEEKLEGAVYKIRPENVVQAPGDPSDYPVTVIGVDFGYSDGFATCVIRYNPARSEFYVLESSRTQGLWAEGAARVIKDLMAQYTNSILVGDPARKATLSEMSGRFGVVVLPAKRTDKAERIRSLNHDLQSGCCRIVESTNTELLKELRTLELAFTADGKPRERSGMQNDCCDALLYAQGATNRPSKLDGDLQSKRLTPEEQLIKNYEASLNRPQASRYY